VSATREPGEPIHSPDNVSSSRSVWYQWQAPASGSVTFTTAGSAFDTVMGIYTGSSVSTLTTIDRHDDVSGTDKTSSITFAAIAGTTYSIAVDGYNNSGSGGDVGPIVLNWNASNCSVSVQLSAAAFNVNEDAGTLNVNVTRTGNTGGQSTVNYATNDSFNVTEAMARVAPSPRTGTTFTPVTSIMKPLPSLLVVLIYLGLALARRHAPG
jgi:hypothetical protein